MPLPAGGCCFRRAAWPVAGNQQGWRGPDGWVAQQGGVAHPADGSGAVAEVGGGVDADVGVPQEVDVIHWDHHQLPPHAGQVQELAVALPRLRPGGMPHQTTPDMIGPGQIRSYDKLFQWFLCECTRGRRHRLPVRN
jgi:hypothetical protein